MIIDEFDVPHSELREIKTWRSYGKDGTDPPIDTLIKDLGDEHLLNIIKHLEDRFTFGPMNAISDAHRVMCEEVAWRMRDCWQQSY